MAWEAPSGDGRRANRAPECYVLDTAISTMPRASPRRPRTVRHDAQSPSPAKRFLSLVQSPVVDVDNNQPH